MHGADASPPSADNTQTYSVVFSLSKYLTVFDLQKPLMTRTRYLKYVESLIEAEVDHCYIQLVFPTPYSNLTFISHAKIVEC
jgi:hypothetical protein